jgi:hypothetical protein
MQLIAGEIGKDEGDGSLGGDGDIERLIWRVPHFRGDEDGKQDNAGR